MIRKYLIPIISVLITILIIVIVILGFTENLSMAKTSTSAGALAGIQYIIYCYDKKIVKLL